MGLSNVFSINNNLIVTDNYKDHINDVTIDEPLLNRMIKVLITRNNQQYTKFIFRICKDEMIYKKIDDSVVDMYHELNYSYFSYVTLKIDWLKNINHNTNKSLVVNNNLIEVIELCFPHMLFKYNNNNNILLKFVFDPNISMCIIACDKQTINCIRALRHQHEIASYVTYMYMNHMNNVQSIDMNHILFLPTINTKHIIHNTYRKNHIDEPTTSSTSINWINGIEYHEVQLDENGLVLGTGDCHVIDTKIKEMIDCDDNECEHLTSKVTNNFIILLTLNEHLIWYMICHD